MADKTLSAMQSDMRSILAAHMIAVIRVYDEAGNVIETSTRAISKSGEFAGLHRKVVFRETFFG